MYFNKRIDPDDPVPDALPDERLDGMGWAGALVYLLSFAAAAGLFYLVVHL